MVPTATLWRRPVGRAGVPLLTALKHYLPAVGIATEGPGTSAAKRGTRGEGVLHELEIVTAAIVYLGDDGKRRVHHLGHHR
jgi:hypothetical protein